MKRLLVALVCAALAAPLPVNAGSVSLLGAGGGQSGNPLFGINVSGPEFAPWNGQTFPTSGDWSYLASKGVKRARLPIAWESIQPILSAALDPTYLASLKTSLSAAAANGIGVEVDLHNFGQYCDQAHWVSSGCGYAGNAGVAGTGVSVLGDATLTQAAFADVWTRLSTALLGQVGVAGYGIMSEPAGITPTNLILTPNYFGNGIGAQPWFVQNGSVVTQLAAGTNPLGASYGPAWTVTSGSGFGDVCQNISLLNVPYTLDLYARVASGTGPLLLEITGGVAVQRTATTTWTRYTLTGTPSAGISNTCVGVNSASVNVPIQIANAQLVLGSSEVTYQPSPYNVFAQAAISAVRAVDATTPVVITGYGNSNPAFWQANNYELDLLTGANRVYDAHAYFDGPQAQGGPGKYSGTYTSYGIDNQSGVQMLAGFDQWISDQSQSGFIGEFNVPNLTADNDAQWLVLQQNFIDALLVDGIPATMWFYGANGSSVSNILNVAPSAGVDDPRLLQMLQTK